MAASTPLTTFSRAFLLSAARIPGAAPRWLAAPAPLRRSLATQSASGPAVAEPPPDASLSPSSFEGSRLLAKLAMLVYWNAGQDGFWDPEYDGAALDLATPFGFEPFIASDPAALRREVLELCVPAQPPLWLCPDPGAGPNFPTFASVAEARLAPSRTRQPPAPVSRVAVLRLEQPNWIVVIFRGTTPSPMRGGVREGQVNSMAGQEDWSEAPAAMQGARVHQGYSAAYRTVLAEVEGAVTAWARKEAEANAAAAAAAAAAGDVVLGGAGSGGSGNGTAAPRVVVVGHSLGGALAALCSARLAHDLDVLALAAGSHLPVSTGALTIPSAVECVTFGQPRVGDTNFRAGVDDHSPHLKYLRVVSGGGIRVARLVLATSCG
jgi:hypothetical protein